MPEWIVVSRSQHADKHYLARSGYAHASKQILSPVLLTELPKLLAGYVVGFVATGQSFQAVTLLGLEKNKNLYVNHDGKWLGSYVPASVRGYPFGLGKSEQGELVLCIDSAHIVQPGDGGAPLFDENGEPTKGMSSTLDFLNQCENDRQRTQAAVDALQAAGVIKPWELSIDRGEGEDPAKIGGLYRVDEHALNTLAAEDYASLQGAPMALAHVHLFSVSERKQLTDRYAYHAQQSSQESTDDLDHLFGEGDDDDLSFDF